jgi:hypothetical protein
MFFPFLQQPAEGIAAGRARLRFAIKSKDQLLRLQLRQIEGARISPLKGLHHTPVMIDVFGHFQQAARRAGSRKPPPAMPVVQPSSGKTEKALLPGRAGLRTISKSPRGARTPNFFMDSTSDTSQFALNTDGFNNATPINPGFLYAGVTLTPTGGVTLETNSFTSGTYDTGTKVAQSVTGLGGVNTGVNLFVLKLQFVAGAGDTVSLFLNPTVGAPEGSATASITTTGDFAFSAANWYAGHSAGFGTLDEIRFASTYDAATVPEPSTYVMLLGGAGALILFRRRRAA